MSSPRHRMIALRVVCRTLKGEPASPTRSPQSQNQHAQRILWNEVLMIADELVVGPALWGAAAVVADGIPIEVAGGLRERQLANVSRNIRLRQLLTEAVEALNCAGIVPLLFKGASELAAGGHDVVSNRWMADLDVLVPPIQVAPAGSVLERLGYMADPGCPFSHPHEVPFVRGDSPGPIELHAQLGSPPIPSVLPLAEAWPESSELQIGVARARVLSPTHQVLHNVLHSAVQDLNHAVGGLPLRQLLTLSRLVQLHGPAIDWPRIQRRMARHGLERTLNDHLWLTHRFTGMPFPLDRRGLRPRLHEMFVLANFSLSWPPHVQRNLRFAFGHAYLDSLYSHEGRPCRVAAARARHAARVLRRDGRTALQDVLVRRN